MSLFFWEAFQVVAGRTELTADQRPTLTTLQTGVDVNMAETLWLGVVDLQVLVADHVSVSEHLAAGNETSALVKSQRTVDALHQL